MSDPHSPVKKAAPLAPPGQPEESDETAHYDDAIIGRAFRWSFVGLILLVCGAFAAFLILKQRKPAEAARITEMTAPSLRQAPVAEIPRMEFVEIAREAGIDFIHDNGATGEKLLPETMGGGVVFFDYDNDGLPDLLFVNSCAWETAGTRSPGATMALYRNLGGTFTNVTAGSGLDVSFYGMGAAAGDFDNDGWTDVYVTAVGHNRLFRNNGDATFSDVTENAGVGGNAAGWSSSAAFFDFDNDSDLDLIVCNYVEWSREIDFEVNYTLLGIGRAYGQPMNFAGTFPALYRNEGDGRFTDVSAEAGVQIRNPSTGLPLAKSLGVVPVDLDQDGWMDFVVANDTVQNFLFLNQKNGTFKEIGDLAGVAFDRFGMTRGAMGIDCGYYRNDGRLGIAIANFANEMTALFVSQASPLQFADEAIPEGVGPASRLLLKFGLFFFDYDLDGRLDLLTANGHLEEEIAKVQRSQHYAQSAQLFWNAGPDHPSAFVAVPPEKAGADLFRPIVGRGSAYADIDGDGDLDVVLTQIAGPPLLLRNDQQLGHDWLRIRLVGNHGNRSAIGAIVKVQFRDETLTRVVNPSRSYLSQSELPLTFGLGRSNQIERCQIIWPGGKVQEVPTAGLKLRAMNVIEEPRD